MDIDNSGETTITVIIKTPNQAFQDQTVEGVHLNWTVKDLKIHLSTVYPSKPVSRLISYSESASRNSPRPCSGMLVAFPC